MLNNILNIEGATVLSKEQQKTIIGGSGTCAVLLYSAPGFSSTIHENISYDTAMSALAANSEWGGRWCCDSCDQASWLNNNDVY